MNVFANDRLSDSASKQNDETSDRAPPLTKAYETVERAVFAFYVLCSYDMCQWDIAFTACWLIPTLQFCHFISNAYIHFGWSSRVAAVFLAIVDFVTEIPFVSPSQSYIFSSVVIMGFFLFGVLTAWLRYWPLVSVMRAALMWIPTVFFVPLALPHLKLVFGCLGDDNRFFESQVCWGSDHALLTLLSLVLLIAFSTAAIITTAIFYNNEVPASYQVRDNPTNARSTNRPELLLLIGKIITLILFISSTSSSWRYATSIILLGLGLWTTVLNYTYLPWWRWIPQSMYLFTSMLVAWTGLIGVVMTATADAEGTGMLYFAFMPVLAVSAVMLHRRRMFQVGEWTEQDLTAPHMVEVKIRYIIHAYICYMEGLGDIYVEFTPEEMGKRLAVVDKVIKMMEFGYRRFPKSCELHTSCALVYTTVLYNRVMSYRWLNSAMRLQPRLDLRFHLGTIQRLLKAATRKEQSAEVANFLAFKQHRSLVDGATAEASRHLVHFWTELLQPQPDIDALSVTGQAAREALSRTLAHVDRLLELNPDSVPVLRLSAMIYLELTGEVQRAVANFERADQLESDKKRISLEYDYSNFLQRLDNANLDIFDEENGVITISVNPETVGTIESVNPALLRMFGYTREHDLVGKSMNMLLPEPIAGQHDALIADYMLTRQSRVVNATRMVFGLHHMQYLVGLSMHVRWSDEALGHMIAVLHPILNSYEVCVIADAAGTVTYGTQNFHSVFGFPKRDIFARQVSIKQMLPVLDSTDDTDHADVARVKLYSKAGLSCGSAHALTQQRFHVQAFATVIPIRDEQLTFVRCHVTQAQSEPSLDDDMDIIPDAPLEGLRRGSMQGPLPPLSPSSSSAQAYADDQALTASLRAAAEACKGDDDGRESFTNDLTPGQPLLLSSGTEQATTTATGSASASTAHPVQVPVLFPFSDAKPPLAPNANLPASASWSQQPPPHPTYAMSTRSNGNAPLPSRPQLPTAGTSTGRMTGRSDHTWNGSPGSSWDPTSPRFNNRVFPGHPALSDAPASASASASTTLPIPALHPSHTEPSSSPTSAHHTPHAGVNVPLLDIPESAAADEMLARDSHAHARAVLSPSASQHATSRPPSADKSVDDAASSTSATATKVSTKPAASAASTNSLVRNKRTAQGHKRLLTAIANDSARTTRQLRLMNIASVAMIVIVLALNIALFLISNSIIGQSTELTESVAASVERQTVLMDMVTQLRIYKQMAVLPGLQTVVDLFYMPGVHASSSYNDVYSAYEVRVQRSLDDFTVDTLKVDSTPSSNSDLIHLRNDDDALQLELYMGGSKTTFSGFGLQAAAASVAAATRWAIGPELTVPINDADFYFFTFAAGISSLRTAAELNSELLVVEQENTHEQMIMVTAVILTCSVVAVLLVLFFFIRPLVLRIEAGKSQVLLIFQSVPYSMRKALRKKAYIVNKMVRRDTDDAIARTMEEDDDDKDKQSGAASQAGSEWTSYTKYSDATSAAFLRRYNKPPSAASVPVAATPGARRNNMAQGAITSARLSGSPPKGVDLASAAAPAMGSDAEADASIEMERGSTRLSASRVALEVLAPPALSQATSGSAQGSETRSNQQLLSSSSPRGSVSGALTVPAPAVSLSAASASPATNLPSLHPAQHQHQHQHQHQRQHHDIDLSMHSHGTSTKGADPAAEDELRAQIEGEKSLMARRAMTVLVSKYGFFLIVIGLYFGLCLWQATVQLDAVENSTRLMAVASLRMPNMQFAFFQARQYLFYRYDTVVNNVADASTRAGPYRASAIENLDAFRRTVHGTLYGDEGYRLSLSTLADDQFSLIYEDACSVDPVRFKQLVPSAPDYVLNECRSVEDGLLEHGLYGALDFIDTQVSLFVDSNNEAALYNFIYGLPPPPGQTVESVNALLDTLQRTSLVVNEYVYFFLKYSSALYLEQTIRILDDTRNILIIFLTVFSVFLAVCYVALFHPMSIGLLKASTATKSMMLLLPPDVIRHVVPAQKYIEENRE